MKRVLIIAYYWPPSGGAGVQRWLKLTKYLSRLNAEVHVLTVNPDEASYMQVDESLCNDVSDKIHVHSTTSFEPINYYAKIVGKSSVPTAGFSNVNNQSWKQKAVTFLRTNLFIPDPRKGWNKYAYPKAVELIEKYNINNVITTSPPHSTQLIGLKLKKKFNESIHWICDFRDPWTDIYYYDLLQHSSYSKKKDAGYEKQVIETCDEIITVGTLFQESFLSKTNTIDADKFTVIPNGFDPEDFQGKTKNKESDSSFNITYTGTISDHYEPQVFFVALARLIKENPADSIVFTLVGIISEKLRTFIVSQLGTQAEFLPPISHDKAIDYMVNADVLLLVTQGKEGTIPGKTFEYLASTNRIISIGKGDAGIAIEDCAAGKSFERDEEDAIFEYLTESLNEFKQGKTFESDAQKRMLLSRSEQAAAVFNLLKD